MLLSILAVLAGFGLLIWGADRFVMGAAALARNLGVSTLLIGLTIVGFGTSAPEMLVAATASLDGSPVLAVGNALGSNIANIGLILGITALVAPLTLHSQSLRREYPLLLVIRIGLARGPVDPLGAEIAAEIPSQMPTAVASGWFALGLAVLPVSYTHLRAHET